MGQTSPKSGFQGRSYWRDYLWLSLEFHTLRGPESIAALLQKPNGCRIKSMTVDDTLSRLRCLIPKADSSKVFLRFKRNTGQESEC
ncbi:hypothetical protein BJ878DRAFT_333306 [Calycina marina]|uniref:Uncharacterized protein n=1 Tax=Calycina marina TaxID=1763456 RepID=A0A9P7Z632_9HELO|nr:hypothetical protein BJ878DRAFT_333306 [Calycina marina]